MFNKSRKQPKKSSKENSMSRYKTFIKQTYGQTGETIRVGLLIANI